MAGFQDLRQFLSDSGELVVSMTFSEIEKVIGRSLPPSAHKHAAFWANSERNAYGRHWLGAGYRATRSGGSARTITFVRFRSPKPIEPSSNQVTQTRVAPHTTQSADIIVIGCVNQKGSTASPAKDLYTSGLFAGRRRYAERKGAPWVIASALHGLVEPDEIVGLLVLRAGKRKNADISDLWGMHNRIATLRFHVGRPSYLKNLGERFAPRLLSGALGLRQAETVAITLES